MSRKFCHSSKNIHLTGDHNTSIPLPIVFKLSDQVTGPLKDTSQMPIVNGILDQCRKRILIHDLSSAQCLLDCGNFGSPIDVENSYKIDTFLPPNVHTGPLNPSERKRDQTSKESKSSIKSSMYWETLSSVTVSKLPTVDELVDGLYRVETIFPCASSTRDDADKNVPILQLDLLESFYLFDVLGTIRIHHNNELVNTREELWQLFHYIYDPQDNDNFVTTYAAYFYFRSKGWVVKPGFKFGSDFVLYKDGPTYNHSLFCVTVVTVSSDGKVKTALPPGYLSGLARVSRSVQKHALICFVKLPIDDEICHIVSKCTLRCVHIERWNPDLGITL